MIGAAKTCGSTLNALAKCNVSVTFTPTAAGQRGAQLVTSDDAYNTPQTAQLTGLAAASLAPAAAKFGTVKTGTTSKPVKFTLTNNQSVTLNNIAASTTGDFAVSATTCAASLASKGKCTISVTFTPTGTGLRTGELIVSDSADNSPQTATLTGTGH